MQPMIHAKIIWPRQTSTLNHLRVVHSTESICVSMTSHYDIRFGTKEHCKFLYYAFHRVFIAMNTIDKISSHRKSSNALFIIMVVNMYVLIFG